MKQEEINKRFDERFDDECITREDLKSFLHSEISLAVAEREEQIFSRLKELGCGDAVNVIEMELHYKPNKKQLCK